MFKAFKISYIKQYNEPVDLVMSQCLWNEDPAKVTYNKPLGTILSDWYRFSEANEVSFSSFKV